MVADFSHRCLSRQTLRKVSCCCALIAISAVGCRGTQQGALPNPFLSADKVPAPATRLPAPGGAQPYYPGDAIPPFPGGQSAAPVSQPVQEITPIPPQGSFAANEPAVRIPGDESTIRFAARPSGEPGSVPGQRAGGNQRAPFAEHQPVANRDAPLQPTEVGSPRVAITPVVNEGAVSGLFRQPVDRPRAPALMPETNAPRIRLPGSGTHLQEPVVAPGRVNTMSYEAPIGTVQTMVLPPAEFSPVTNAPKLLPADGFRPRRSARSTWDREQTIPSMATLRVTPG